MEITYKSVTADLKIKYSSLWSDMTNHAFVNEMGMGTLDPEKFRRYFLQDYVFVNDLVVLTAKGISKSPDFDSASVLNHFLTGILNSENDLFVRFFNELGYSEKQYSIATANYTTQAFGDFLVRTGYEGDFDAINKINDMLKGLDVLDNKNPQHVQRMELFITNVLDVDNSKTCVIVKSTIVNKISYIPIVSNVDIGTIG